MIRFYFIRHGETIWNTEGRYQGWTDISLSSVGEKQAQLLGKRFENIDVDEIYSSPLKRAKATASEIASRKNKEIIISENFKEINFGEWEGHTVSELKEKFGEHYSKFLETPHKIDFPGEGSFGNVIKRIEIGINEIIEKNKEENKNIVIVSHGGILKIAILHLMGIDLNLYMRTWLDNTSVSVLEYRKDKFFLVSLNDKSHLESMEK